MSALKNPAPAEAHLAGLSFALVGAGRVGLSLARWLAAAGARATAVGVRPGGARRPEAEALARELGGRTVPLDLLASAGCDLLLIAVSDPALDEVAATLSRRPQAAVALHTAGSRGASALARLARPLPDEVGAAGPAGRGGGGSAVGSFHPLKAFPRALTDPAAAHGTFFALDGDPPAVELGLRLAAALGGTAAAVPEERRGLYHFAATLAAGGTTTLVAAAQALAARLGLPREVGRGYLELARGALAAVDGETADAAAAITGPAVRGDRETVLGQLDELAAAAPRLVPLALVVARESLRLGAREPALAAPRGALADALESRIAAAAAGGEFLDHPRGGC